MRQLFVQMNPFLQSQWDATYSLSTVNAELLCNQLLIVPISPLRCLQHDCRGLYIRKSGTQCEGKHAEPPNSTQLTEAAGCAKRSQELSLDQQIGQW